MLCFTKKYLSCLSRVAMVVAAVALIAPSSNAGVLMYDQDVTSNVIFGSGNANGGFTVDRANGVELGLRAKLRHNASGSPENTFNSNGDGSYSFNPGVAPGQSFPTAEWSFEWSINSDFANSTGRRLGLFTYELSMSSTNAASIASFDPINGAGYFDHAFGDSSTANGAGLVAVNAFEYAFSIRVFKLAQNSWKPHWFATSFDPTLNGIYNFQLAAFDSSGSELARTSINVNVGNVPEPASILAFACLGLGATMGRRRKRASKA